MLYLTAIDSMMYFKAFFAISSLMIYHFAKTRGMLIDPKKCSDGLPLITGKWSGPCLNLIGGVGGVTPTGKKSQLPNRYEMLRQSAKSFFGSFKSVMNESSRRTKLAKPLSWNSLGKALIVIVWICERTGYQLCSHMIG